MNKIKNEKEIIGGQSLSGPVINALVGAINAIYNIGHSVGGSLRRIQSGNMCPL